jgi:hypothetical protein
VSVAAYFSQTTVPFGLVPPPQQAWLSMQAMPVMMQPDAGKHTIAPLPGSEQLRVQQLELPVHGIPPMPQPPLNSRQYPAVPSFLLHSFSQQSPSP